MEVRNEKRINGSGSNGHFFNYNEKTSDWTVFVRIG